LDPALIDGFEAARTLQAWKNAVVILDDQKKVRMNEAAAKESALKTASKPQQPQEPPKPVSKEEKALLSVLKDIGVASRLLMDSDIHPVLNKIAKNEEKKLTADEMTSAKRWLFFNLLYWYYPSLVDALKAIPTELQNLSTELARKIFQAIPSRGSNPAITSFNDLGDSDKEKVLIPVINQHRGDGLWGWWYGQCIAAGVYMTSDAGLPGLLTSFDTAYTTYLNNENSKDDDGNKPGDKAAQQANAAQDKAEDEDKLEMKFGLDLISHAQERYDALAAHLLEHINYYKYVLFQALPPSEQIEHIMNSANLKVGTFEPRVVSMRGEYLAIPFITAMDPDLDKILKNAIQGLGNLTPVNLRTQKIMIPAQGITIDSRLGKCSTCEDYIKETRTIELQRLKAVAKQAEYEADRLEYRLKAVPKLLENPTPSGGSLRIKLEKETEVNSPG
jgi:hypothetical protein